MPAGGRCSLSKLRTLSVVLLALVGLLTLVGSFGSAYLAYGGSFPIGGVSITDIAGGRQPVLLGLRGVRGTSAAWAAAWAVRLDARRLARD
jgi:drug/metabolite transporter superfamily protein YnfA